MVNLGKLWTILDLLVGIFGLSMSNCVWKLPPEALGTVSGRFGEGHFLELWKVRLSQLWSFPDPLVVAAGSYGSETSPKVVPIRSEDRPRTRFRTRRREV